MDGAYAKDKDRDTNNNDCDGAVGGNFKHFFNGENIECVKIIFSTL